VTAVARRLTAVTVATILAIPSSAHAEDPPWVTPRADDATPPDDPDDDADDTDDDDNGLDEDGEPHARKTLPENGRALTPTLPWLARDLIQPRTHPAGRSAATVGFASIDDDCFLELTIGHVFQLGEAGDWRIAPRLPLRLRLADGPPETDAVIREEDWDEVSDWARVLAFVHYGRIDDPLVLRYGELTGVTLGHGTLVNRYSNTIDLDHYQGGIYVAGDLDLIGAEAVLNDVFDPDLLAGRIFARPFVGIDDLPLPVRGFKVALTLGADFAAPVAVDTGAGGLFATPENHPVVLGDRFLPMVALDFEVPVLSSPHVDIVPYLDIATLDFETVGVHLGSFFNVRFTPATTLRTRLEYRFVGEDHVPGYVSPFYEIERYAWLGGPPKLGQLDALTADEGLGAAHHGVHLESDLAIEKHLALGFVYTSNGRERGNDLLARLRLERLGPVRLTLFFARLGFSGFDDLFAADRTLGGVSLRVTFEPFFVTGRILNEWRLRSGDDGKTGFQTVLTWSLGGGLMVRL
jgi:hypothetical protein